jgi:hypothetical protein
MSKPLRLLSARVTSRSTIAASRFPEHFKFLSRSDLPDSSHQSGLDVPCVLIGLVRQKVSEAEPLIPAPIELHSDARRSMPITFPWNCIPDFSKNGALICSDEATEPNAQLETAFECRPQLGSPGRSVQPLPRRRHL